MWQKGLHQYCFKNHFSKTAVMDKLYLSSPYIFEINITSHHTNRNTHTHTVTFEHAHTLAVLHRTKQTHKRLLHSHPSNFGDVEQFPPKRFMDSLIMQQQKTRKQTNIIQYTQQIHDKCIADTSALSLQC